MKKMIMLLIVLISCALVFATGGGGGDSHSCSGENYTSASDSRTFYRAYNQGRGTAYMNWTGFQTYYDHSCSVQVSYTCYGLGKTEGYNLYKSVGYRGTNQGNTYLNSVLNSRALNNIVPYNCWFI